MPTFFRSALFPLIVIVLLVYLASQTLLGDDSTQRTVAYADVERVVRERPQTVDEVTFQPAEQLVVLELRGGDTLEARYPSNAARAALERNVVAQRNPAREPKDSGSAWWSLLTALLPFVLLLLFWAHLTKRADRRRAESAIPSAKDFRSDTANQ